MEMKSLHETTLSEVHSAFLRAFSDYEVQFDLPIEKFTEMLKTRDVRLDFSIGCFEEGELIAFILCGYRKMDHLECCYDRGTGTVKEYRHRGIGKRLLREWLAALQKRSMDRVYLEVLENNTPAIALYQKAGFRISRSFSCVRCKKALIPAAESAYSIDDDIQHYLLLDRNEHLTFKPSWQNSRESVINVLDKYAYVGLAANTQLLGYGLVHKVSGNIAQIGISSDCFDKGLEGFILSELGKRTESETLAFVNIERGDYLERKLKGAGFDEFVGQFEMERFNGIG